MIDKDKLIIELQTTADYLFETDRDDDFRYYIEHIIRKIKESNFDVIKKTCKWKLQDEDEAFDSDKYYETECGQSFYFTHGLKDDEYKYCPYCGKKIEEIR